MQPRARGIALSGEIRVAKGGQAWQDRSRCDEFDSGPESYSDPTDNNEQTKGRTMTTFLTAYDNVMRQASGGTEVLSR